MKIKINTLILVSAVSAIALAGCAAGNSGQKDEVSGEYYDYTVTMQPERPYMLEYDRAMMMKLFLARPDGKGGSNVGLTFSEVLEVIKGMDVLSRGIPKIVYLVGWQYEGHDWKYPAFHEFNESLRRPEDASARDSYLWLQKEAKKYNTTVSVHMLVHDAEPNSPLWDEYVENDLICRDVEGNLISRAVFNGLPMYDVNLAAEWEKGYLQKRLDELIRIANLGDARTVHCDAFYARESPYHGDYMAEQETAMRKMLRYMRDRGVDVTVEFLHNGQRCDPMIGLTPAVWWLDMSAAERAVLPASLIAGGQEGKFGRLWHKETFLFGDNYQGEDDFNFVDCDPSKDMARAWKKAKYGIATRTLPYMYFKSHKIVEYDADSQTDTYSGGLVADYPGRTVARNGILLRDGDDVFFPVVWNEMEIVAYSRNGYTDRSWTLPEDWKDVRTVSVCELTEKGEGEPVVMDVKEGTLTLTLAGDSMVSVRPVF